jgi:adenosylhomocysteinase
MESSAVGNMKIEWAMSHMKILNKIEEKFVKTMPFKGKKISMALHVEAKTAYLAIVLKKGGAEVSLTGCNPLSSDDSVISALKENYGINVYGKKGESEQEYWENFHKILEINPDYLIDDGADLISLVHKEYPSLISNLHGANEETTTGIVRLKAMHNKKELKIPVIDVNDAYMKHLFDNRYGTGQSTFDGIFTATNLSLSGSTVVVAGYGWCGRGIALRAKGLGAKVIVTEIDPIKAIEANMEGYNVMKMSQAIKYADFVVTATGCTDVVSKKDLLNAKEGVILSNAGHFNKEISLPDLNELAISKKMVRPFVEEYTLKNNKKIYLLGEGRLINLVAGQGHPVEIMDLSFSLQALSAEYLINKKYKPKVYPVPKAIDEKVAKLALKTRNIKIDRLTKKQKIYLNTWNEGT